MFSRLRNHFGTAGLVVAIVALIAALAGGAVAANSGGGDNATASAKKAKKGPRGPRGPAGAPGLAGATGPAGAPGLAGLKGATGATGLQGGQGDPGADGKTVLSGEGVPGAATGSLGDFYIDTATSEIYGPKQEAGPNNGWGFPTSLLGDDGDPGDPGQPWSPDSQLPGNATLTGEYTLVTKQAASASFGPGFFVNAIAVSFPVALASGLGESDVHFVTGAVPAACENDAHPGAASVANPEADSGHFCVYSQALAPGASLLGIQDHAENPGTDTAGAILVFKIESDPAVIIGTWAVTG